MKSTVVQCDRIEGIGDTGRHLDAEHDGQLDQHLDAKHDAQLGRHRHQQLSGDGQHDRLFVAGPQRPQLSNPATRA